MANSSATSGHRTTVADTAGTAAIDPDAMRRAETVIEQLRWTYIQEWAPAAMKELEDAVQDLQQASGPTTDQREAHHDTILRLTHDMKGQAGTFGLDLLQDFAASLHDCAAEGMETGKCRADLFQAHTSAMRSALSDASANPAGAIDPTVERQLREGLKTLAQMRFN